MSHLPLPICQNQVGRWGKGKWQRREFSAVQEGNCNYGSSANVRGPSWFWSACSLRTPSSLVSPHASQASVLNGRTCSGSGQHEAWKPAGACGWATCKTVTTFFCPPHSNPHGHIPSCWLFLFLFPFSFFIRALSVNVTAAVGPPGPPEPTPRYATPHTWEVRREASKIHTDDGERQRSKKTEWEGDTGWKQADVITQMQSLGRKCISGCQDD